MSTIAASSDTVETLTERIGAFVLERQRLRASAADRQTLEQNRLQIAELQQRLSVALIRRYLPA